jgi:hypothetical protein
VVLVGDPLTWVVTIRVWADRRPVRIRMLIGVPGDSDVDEFVVTSIDETCAALAAYLRDRVG